MDVLIQGISPAELVGRDLGEDRGGAGRVLPLRAGLGDELLRDRDHGRMRCLERLERQPTRAVLLLPLEAAAHSHEVVEGDLAARVAVCLPFLDGRRGVELETPVTDQHPDDRRGEALGDGERRRRLVWRIERVVALVDDLTALDDDDRAYSGGGVVGTERGGDSGIEHRAVDPLRQIADGPVERGVRNVRRLLGIVRRRVRGRQGRRRGIGRRRFGRRRIGRRGYRRCRVRRRVGHGVGEAPGCSAGATWRAPNCRRPMTTSTPRPAR